uniref:T9SS type A sorting domain-containing protein n=1 Tax=Flavobacterium sp. TaxID=239 RepID=UPI0040492E9A
MTIAQNAGIRVKGTAPDVSGTEITVDANTAAQDGHILDFTVDNLTGSTQDWALMRVRITPSIGWVDQVCWGSVSLTEGNCSTPTGDSFTTGYTLPVETTTTDAEINIYIDAPTGGSSSFRYYIMDGSNKVDSVDVTITKSLGINENVSLGLSVAPNPASNVVSINMDGVSSANLKIVDVLGNVVLKETVYESSKKVDVTKFKNGIYFVTAEAEGIKPIT